MSLTAYRKILILCPERTRTGGPEAMHQLGRALLDLGHDVGMVYAADHNGFRFHDGAAEAPESEAPMPPEYAHYRVPRAMRVPDSPDVAVVLPEMWPDLAAGFARATPHLWWLSIDNGLRPLERAGGLDSLRRTRCVHLCQSFYALTWLMERNVIGLPLFDYTTPGKTAATPAERASPRAPRVLYPMRGRWFTEWMRKWAPGLAWQEISGFTAEQVRDLFLTSRLYVDFGSHPGKDRMPREAVSLGCCVVTGRRGAAANPLDIPIPDRYKFRDSRYMIPRIVREIKTILAEYDTRLADFARYRAAIHGEKREFTLQALRVFGGRLELGPEPGAEDVPADAPTRVAA
jgi:hypothetical protein